MILSLNRGDFFLYVYALFALEDFKSSPNRDNTQHCNVRQLNHYATEISLDNEAENVLYIFKFCFSTKL